MAFSEIIHSTTLKNLLRLRVGEKRANTAKNIRNIESKLQTKQRATKISEKKFHKKNDFTGNYSQYDRHIKHLRARHYSKTVFTEPRKKFVSNLFSNG